MPNTVNPSMFIGFLGPRWPERDSGDLAAKVARAGGIVSVLPGAAGLIATWNGQDIDFTLTDSGAAIACIGHLRPGGQTALSSLGDRFQRGDDALVNELRGDFALAIVDSGSGRALLAVDHVGIGAMFFARTEDGTLVFASDLALIRDYAPIEFAIDPQAIYDYTYYHAVPSPLTIYSGVSKLPPGHCLSSAAGADTVRRYWVPGFTKSSKLSERELSAELMSVLRSSVERCASDAGIGGFLSGGLDSSTVCGMLRQAVGHKVPAVSVGFDEEGYDEVSFAKTAADHFDLDHIVHYMTPDEIADSIGLIVQHYAEPFGNSSVVPSYICALTAAENGIKTLLAGDGGDELFAGNTRYAKQKLFEYYLRIPAALRSGITDAMFDGPDRAWQIGPLRKIHRYITQANVPLPGRLQTFNMMETRTPGNVFCEDFLAAVNPDHPRTLLHDEYHATDTDPVNRMLFSDWRFTLADNDLRKVIRTCQIANVNVRFPLLDDDVIDFSIRVPASLKLKGLKLRHFYREALRGYLPDAVLNKSKHGFGLPFGEWLKQSDRLQEMVHDALSGLRKRGIYSNAFIDSLIEAHSSQHAAYFGNMVWVLAMLEWWLASHEPGFNVSN